ncbi:MAG TPA: YggS family pyridoxal phosphate-dependent enzyme [Burkholderiales bacterium]|nr:YggS family pyridoxal phosphate-dependent enzyme [Burkholderiales bacterium]
MINYDNNFQTIIKNINIAKSESIYHQEVKCVAVSKLVTHNEIRILNKLGQKAFAESDAIDFQKKVIELHDLNIEWHFIGPIQSNKIQYIATNADWVQSIEKIKHIIRFNALRSANLPKLNILIEVKINNEKNKHGVINEEEIIKLADIIKTQDKLLLRGLMGIASNTSDEKILTNEFNHLKNIFDNINKLGYNMDTLSMGMSNDYKIAIACGTTMIRIGRNFWKNQLN